MSTQDEDLLPFRSEEQEREERGSTGRYRKRRRRGRVILVSVLVFFLVVVLGIAGAGWLVVNNVAGDIERIPNVFDDLPEQDRPVKPAAAEDSVNILLAGLDGENSTEDETGSRSDAIMVLHLNADRENAYLVSIPRDSYVPIPGHGENKVNAAYSFGGPSLYVQTIEELTGLRIDHLAVIDWSGFRGLTDALGGVDLDFDEAVETADGTVYDAGTHTLDGEESLQYVRERYGLPGGDFDRVKRQQNFLRGLMNKTLSADTLGSPGTLLDVAGSISEAARLDDEFGTNDMVSLGFSLRNLRGSDVSFLTVPTNGTGMAGAASIVNYDFDNAERLWEAIGNDDAETFIAENPDLVTGEQVR